jgi:hypothetical protein
VGKKAASYGKVTALPSFRTHSQRKVCRSMEKEIGRTEPSANATFTPPGWEEPNRVTQQTLLVSEVSSRSPHSVG